MIIYKEYYGYKGSVRPFSDLVERLNEEYKERQEVVDVETSNVSS